MSSPEGERTAEETTFFLVSDYILIAIRLAGTSVFIYQAIKYSRLPLEKRDRNTVLTLALLSTSFIAFMIYRLLTRIQVELPKMSQVGDQEIRDNEDLIESIKFIFRPTIAYLFQNLGLFINMYRWMSLLLEA